MVLFLTRHTTEPFAELASYLTVVPGQSFTTLFVCETILPVKPIVKSSFSCLGEAEFLKEFKALKRKRILIAGLESHICVYQTVQDLLKEDYQVEVIVDCVSSRTDQNKQIGLEKMQKLGASLTSKEMILCELLGTSDNKKFKEILEIIK